MIPALLLLSQSLDFGFMSDDFHLIHKVETQGFYTSWGGQEADAFFRPVTVASYFTDNLVWGLNPSGYHLTNIFWHLLCSVLVYLLAVELFDNTAAAFCSGYLFLLLACHSESVAWVSGRTDLIATAFALLSILLFLKKQFLAVPVFAAGLLAKESVIIVPFLWFLLGFLRKDRNNRRIILSGVLICVLYAGVRLLFTPALVSELDSSGISFQSASGILENAVRYSFRVFTPPLPLFLRPLVSSNPIVVPVFLAGLCSALWLLFRKRGAEGGKQILLLAGCFLVSLIPVILMKVSLFDSRAERFLYLPGVFAVLILVKWMYSVFSSGRIAVVILILFSLFQGVFLYRSFGNWQTAGEMCREIVSSGSTEIPDNYRGAYVFRNGYEEAVLLLSE